MKKTVLIFTSILVLSIALYAQNKTTPLIKAVLNNDINLVKTLLKNGVDKNIKDDKGFSALDYAISNHRPFLAQILYGNNLNDFIFLRPLGKPLHVAFSKNSFTFKNPDINNQVIILGTTTPDSFESICESYDKFLEKDYKTSIVKFRIILAVDEQDSFAKIDKIKGKCRDFTTFVYPNYTFYTFLAKLFQYEGAPQLLFRDKFGRLVGGSIETNFFEDNQNFIKLMKQH